MRYAITTMVVLAAMAVGRGDEETIDEPEAPTIRSDAPEYTADQLADARKSKEKRLASLRAEVQSRQSKLNGSRMPLDSPERAKLKADLAEAKQEFADALKKPVAHWVEQAAVDRKIEEERAATAAKVARSQAEFNAKLDRERLEKQGPLAIEAAGLHPNVINIPALTLVVVNRSPKTVVAYTIAVECRDRFDAPAVEIKQDNVYRGISQETISPGGKERGTWPLNLHRNATKVKVWFTRARFSDGTEWRQSDESALENGYYDRVEMR